MSMFQRLILKDGTVIENARCGLSDEGNLWCFVTDEAAELFRGTERIGVIVYRIGNEKRYDQYTYTGATASEIKSGRPVKLSGHFTAEHAQIDNRSVQNDRNLAKYRPDRVSGGEGSGTGDVPAE